MSYVDEQRAIARIALDATEAEQFALAGSGAVREHGLISRPTEDVDLFTVRQAAPRFEQAVDAAIKALEDNGYQVIVNLHNPGFVRVSVTSPHSGYTTDIDFGIDWRSAPPVMLSVGAVLSERDAVGNKVAALFSRAETRDYLDFDAIRESGRYSDRDLLELAKASDSGFDLDMFRSVLARVKYLAVEETEPYGVDEAQLHAIQRRLTAFAEALGKGAVSKDVQKNVSESEKTTFLHPLNSSSPRRHKHSR